MDLSMVILIVCVLLAAVLIALFFVFGRSEAAYTLDIGGGAPRASGGRDESAETTFSSRLMGFGIVIGAAFTALLARLWSMQLVSTDDYTEQAESNRTRTVTTAAPRGRILDRNGTEIVTNRSSLTVVAESDVSDDEIEMQILANLIGMPRQAVYRKIIDSSEGAQSLRTVSTDVSRRVVAYIGEHPAVFEGVSVQQRSQRSYPQGSIAAHVVGYTGAVTSEQLESSDSDESAVQYKSGDIVGQSGVGFGQERYRLRHYFAGGIQGRSFESGIRRRSYQGGKLSFDRSATWFGKLQTKRSGNLSVRFGQ